MRAVRGRTKENKESMRRDHLGIQDRRKVESRAAMEGSIKEVDSREGASNTREGERKRKEQITKEF